MKKYILVCLVLSLFVYVFLQDNFLFGNRKESMMINNVEALSQGENYGSTAEMKRVRTESNFMYYETEETDSCVYVYKCYWIVEYVDCIGKGKLPCEETVIDRGIEKELL
ncbi:hypothetical protein [Xylanibacter muris]|uniref:Uncharacterized protein n=1 Tax=Xylanibacter muris TaxID=2736290 RepID=A0ABX2AKD1_9BACT|nr:hypothetical protein [Xylanibacter muris]NPD91628.1 hypothetical protein [Xylanibacter muris]